MKDKKYEILEDDFILHEERKLYRIKALKEFIYYGVANILEGDIGGYVEGYHNLSQEGKCWVFHEAKVYGNARIKDDVRVLGRAEVFGNAIVRGNSLICDDAKIYGNARLEGSILVYGDSEIYGNAVIHCVDDIEEMATVIVKYGTKVYDNAAVKSNCCTYYIEKGVYLCDNARVYGNNTKSVMTLSDKISNNSVFCEDDEK